MFYNPPATEQKEQSAVCVFGTKPLFNFKTKTPEHQQTPLSKFKLKSQDVSVLLNIAYQMVQTTKTHLIDQTEYNIDFIPSKSNRISMIPFDSAVFSAVFGNLIGRNQMRNVFDIDSLRTNHNFDDYFRTNGTKICFLFKRKQIGESKIKAKQCSQPSVFISLSVIASITKDLSKSNS